MTIYKRLPRKLKKGIKSLRPGQVRSKWQRKVYNRFFKTVINPLSAPGIIELPGKIVLNRPELDHLAQFAYDDPVADNLVDACVEMIEKLN